MIGRCEDCRFWEEEGYESADDSELTGRCRRAAPGFDDRTGRGWWPKTFENDRCGEWKPEAPEWPFPQRRHPDDIPF